MFPNIVTLTAIQEKHKIVNGKKTIDRRVFLPGYLFLYCEEEISLLDIIRLDNVYKFLGEGMSVCLSGSDFEFARWLWQNGGVIGISRIRRTDKDIQVISGPMSYFEKNILKIDYHTRNALVRMQFMEKVSNAWFAFDYEEE